MNHTKDSILKILAYALLTLAAFNISHRAHGAPYMACPRTMPAYFNEQHAFSKLHSINLMEISYARITLVKSKDAGVASMAQQLIDEHMTSDERLSAYASSIQIPVQEFTPFTDNEAIDQMADQAILRELINATPASYDMTYLNLNIDAQKRASDWLVKACAPLDQKTRDFILNEKSLIDSHYQVFLKLRERLSKTGT